MHRELFSNACCDKAQQLTDFYAPAAGGRKIRVWDMRTEPFSNVYTVTSGLASGVLRALALGPDGTVYIGCHDSAIKAYRTNPSRYERREQDTDHEHLDPAAVAVCYPNYQHFYLHFCSVPNLRPNLSQQ
jgi:hypothetical protein